jgi:hypothetical protein
VLVPPGRGYHLSEHFSVTEDGYILRMFRLIHGGSAQIAPRPPVLLQHALMDSSALFVLRGEQKSLGYILAEQGEHACCDGSGHDSAAA